MHLGKYRASSLLNVHGSRHPVLFDGRSSFAPEVERGEKRMSVVSSFDIDLCRIKTANTLYYYSPVESQVFSYGVYL